MKRRILIAAAAAFSLAGAAISAVPASEYVAKAGASDLYEIQSSKLVMKSTNPKLRNFAHEMVTDHTKSTGLVKAAATKSGLKPKPPVLDAKEKADIAALTAATGMARDKLYLQQQKAAHEEALALHKDYAASGDKPALKSTAGKIVPVVQHHIEMLNAMGGM